MWNFFYHVSKLWRKFAWKIAILATQNHGKRYIFYFQISQLFKFKMVFSYFYLKEESKC